MNEADFDVNVVMFLYDLSYDLPCCDQLTVAPSASHPVSTFHGTYSTYGTVAAHSYWSLLYCPCTIMDKDNCNVSVVTNM
jgi:hypothetical protein